MQRKLIAILFAVLTAVFVIGCEHEPDAVQKERKTQGTNYTGLQSKQPAESMDHSPTRAGLNKWMETWEEPGKISYVYLIASNGQKVGYYVFEGLPVSYCASLTPPDRVDDRPGETDLVVKAPSMDGVYYSGSQCNQYFGFDATTGSYIEFSIGGGINFFVTEQPLPVPDVEPLGFTTVEEGVAEQKKEQ